MSPHQSLLVVVAEDSFAKATLPISLEFMGHDWKVQYFVLGNDTHTLRDHLQEIGLDERFSLAGVGNYDELRRLLKNEWTVIFPHLVGDLLLQIARTVREQAYRPIMLAGYGGIVYEGHVPGILNRQPYDIVCLNSEADLRRFSEILNGLGCSSESLCSTGLPFLDRAFQLGLDFPQKQQIEAVLFAGQTSVPRSCMEREFLLASLIDYAEMHPERTVYFKPRIRPGQKAVKPIEFHYEWILKRLRRKRSVPTNFCLTYEQIDQLIQKSQLCLTVSSTACFEALAAGRRIALISDFIGLGSGFGDYGYEFFLGSNCLRTMDSIQNDLLPEIDSNWKTDNLLADGRSTRRIFDRVTQTVDEHRSSPKGFPPIHLDVMSGAFRSYYRSSSKLSPTEPYLRKAGRLGTKALRLGSEMIVKEISGRFRGRP